MFTWGKLESAGEAKQLAAILVDDAQLVVAAVGVELHSEVGEHNLNSLLWSNRDHVGSVNAVWVDVGEVR